MEDNNIGKGQIVQACHQKAVDKRQLCFLHPDSDVDEHHKKHGKDETGLPNVLPFAMEDKTITGILPRHSYLPTFQTLVSERWLKQYGVKTESEHISKKVAAEMLSGFKVEAENLPFSVKGDEASTVKLTASCHFQEYLQEDLSFHVLEKCHGPDGAEGFQILANDKVEVMVRLWERHPDSDKKRLSHFSRHQKKLDNGRFKVFKTSSTAGVESVRRWSRMLAQGPDGSRRVRAMFLRLCADQLSANKTAGKVTTQRWSVIMKEYSH
ncbi:Hypp6642 [Branchiostoma lanceolatum]|uniref:Hypp6642 protein n=1 Tax=Branchiostoma lanceolatum TaxID=7740 RepID=A0A8K0E5F5_BRALA|nr:Hypp6642 [Branchiostoma lanceolatum]